jgi:hypothetical protein
MCKSSCLRQAGVVACPVQQHSAQLELAAGVVLVQRGVSDHASILPVQQVIGEHIHERVQGLWLSAFANMCSRAFPRFVEFVGVKGCQVNVAKLHGDTIRQICAPKTDGCYSQ